MVTTMVSNHIKTLNQKNLKNGQSGCNKDLIIDRLNDGLTNSYTVVMTTTVDSADCLSAMQIRIKNDAQGPCLK